MRLLWRYQTRVPLRPAPHPKIPPTHQRPPPRPHRPPCRSPPRRLQSPHLHRTGRNLRHRRTLVEQARAIQTERFVKNPGTHINSAMTLRQMKTHCQLDAKSSAYLEHAMNDMNFSARAHDHILKVARTLADLAQSPTIRPTDILKAIMRRP